MAITFFNNKQCENRIAKVAKGDRQKIANWLQWECSCFQTFLCLDTHDVYAAGEQEKS